VALDASMVIERKGSRRVVNAADYFIGPAVNIERMTVLRPGEILTAITIPTDWMSGQGTQFYFEKVADRAAWDFALLSVAAAFRMEGERIGAARVVLGAAACVPWRLRKVESALAGRARDAATADEVAPLASRGATALRYNGFKLPLMENLVRRAVRGGA
jgi:xanthine dehydrogenase YagS FAD-binding subunit